MDTRHKQEVLSTEQMLAIGLMLEASSVPVAAEALGVSPCEATSWCTEDARFVAGYNLHRRHAWAACMSRLRKLVGLALDVLAEDLTSEHRRLRQAAAVHILRASALLYSRLKSSGAVTPWKLTGT